VSALLPRGACPGLSTPMPTGDGLLVRLAPTEAMSVDAFIDLCAAARRRGNGIMEVTARGSLQIRGLTPRSAPQFAAEVLQLGIAASEGVLVLTNPLPDAPGEIIDAGPLAAGLRRTLAQAQLALAPKVSIVIDGGGALHLDGLSADIRLRAVGARDASHWLLALQGRRFAPPPPPEGGGGRPAEAGGETTWLGAIAPDRTIETLLAIIGEIAALGPHARASDLLRSRGTDALREQFGIATRQPPERRATAKMVGRHPLRDASLAVGIALPFGHAEADALAELGRRAGRVGARATRPAPDRGLMLIGVPAANASGLAAAAADLGFIVDADDPRRRIAACPGAPACASGFIPARELAVTLAPRLAGLPDGIAIHVSGCAKGCAHPVPAALTVVGNAQGCGIVRKGTARATPCRHVAPTELAAEVTRIFSSDELSLGEGVHG
jgi:precorrin-3B synthase